MKSGIKVMSPFFFSETIVRLILKFTYNVSMPFTKLTLVFHKVLIINMLSPPSHETLYAIRIKVSAEALELIAHTVFQHYPQNSVLRVHPAGGQKDGSQRVPNW